MKSRGFALVILLAVSMLGVAQAQTIQMKADVPFEFIVNGSTLPAGQYTVQSFGSADGKSLMVRGADGRALVNSIGLQSNTLAKQTKLVFHRYGNRYFLSQIWVAGMEGGRELPKSHRELELAKDYPTTHQDVDVVAALR